MKKKQREKLAALRKKAEKRSGSVVSRKSVPTDRLGSLPVFGLNSRKTAVIVGVFLLLLVIIQFLPVLTAPGRCIPYGDQDSENARVFNEFLREYVLQHWKIPLWNPYIFGGMPMIDSFTFPAFYPPYLLYTLIPGLMTVFHHIMLHLLLAGLFTWFLGRKLGLSRWGSLAAAVAFMLTGYTVSLTYAGHGGKIWSCAYIPVVLASVVVLLRKPTLQSVALTGAVVGLQLLAGHAQIVFYTWLTVLIYVVFTIVSRLKVSSGEKPEKSDGADDNAESEMKTAISGNRKLKGLLAGVTALGAAFIIGISIGAVQYLPALQYAGWSNRAKPDYTYLGSYSYPPEEIVTTFLPRAFGYGDPDFNDNDPEMPDYWGRLPIRGSTEYVGTITIFLALFGMAYYFRRKEALITVITITSVGLLFAFLNATGLAEFDSPVRSFFSGLITGAVLSGLRISVFSHEDDNDASLGEKGRYFRFFFFLSALSALLAIGSYLPLYRFTALLPGFDKFRAPAQIMILFSFAFSVMAGFGMDGLLEYVHTEKKTIRGGTGNSGKSGESKYDLRRSGTITTFVVVGVSLLVAGFIISGFGDSFANMLFGRIPGRDGKPLPVSILSIRTARIGREIVLFSSIWILAVVVVKAVSWKMIGKTTMATLLVIALAADLMIVNARFIHPLEIGKEFDEYSKDPIFDLLEDKPGYYRVYNASLDKVPPNEGVYRKIPLVGGYHGAPMGDYWKFMTLNENNFVYKFLMMTSSRYLFLESPVKSDIFREMFRGRVYVYDYLLALPRAYMVFATVTEEDHDRIPEILVSDDFDPSLMAVTEKKTGLPQKPSRKMVPAHIKKMETEYVEVEALAPAKSILVLTDTYYPGWKARVDGREQELLRVNFVQRGVVLPPGKHDVEFVFEPSLNKKAGLLSLAGILILAGLTIISVLSHGFSGRS